MNTQPIIEAAALMRSAAQLVEQGRYVAAYNVYSNIRELVKAHMESLPKRDIR